MKKTLVIILTLIILLSMSGLIESKYCHNLTTTPPPGSSDDYIKANAFCRLNSLPGAIGSILILSPFIDSEPAVENEENIQIKEATTSQVSVIDTENWKEYKNDKYRFTIKYPPDWPVIFVNDVVTIGTPEPDPVDRYTKCYMTFTFTGNRDGGVFVPAPNKFISSMVNEMERTEKCNETLNKITKSFTLLSVNSEFPVTLKNTYTKTKADLTAKGWTPVTPNNCMSRGNSLCEVSFKKGSQTKIVIIESKNNEWIVVGYDN